jgi:Winged helix DNA-binding domain
MLSKQVGLQEAAGYVQVDKVRTGRRIRTWLRLTATGVTTYRRHRRHLQALPPIAGRRVHRASTGE